MIDTEGYKQGFKDGFQYGLAKQDRPVSYWLSFKTDKSHYHYQCFNCHCVVKYKKGNYCPDCGYKMEH